jgi:hypothetical protein
MPADPVVRRLRLAPAAALLVACALLVGGCSALRGSPPAPTPLDFPGIANQIVQQGLAIGDPIAGDAGCSDPSIIATAIGFDVSGAGVTSPVRARVYIFGSHAAYDRRRADVDTCVGAWASDPPNVEFIDASPYVLVVQGPVPGAFKAALTRALIVSAGNGG